MEPPLTHAAGCESAGCGLAECGACGYPGSGMSGGCRHSDVVRADSVGCEFRPRRWGWVGFWVVGGGYASFGRRASAGQELQLQLQFPWGSVETKGFDKMGRAPLKPRLCGVLHETTPAEAHLRCPLVRRCGHALRPNRGDYSARCCHSPYEPHRVCSVRQACTIQLGRAFFGRGEGERQSVPLELCVGEQSLVIGEVG